jgi:hypothetical protein
LETRAALDMTKTATENIGLRAVRVRRRLATTVRFYAFDGTVCVQVEAGSEEDARDLCREVKLDFIGLCQK